MDETLHGHEQLVLPSLDDTVELRQLVPDDAEAYYQLLAESPTDSPWYQEVAGKYRTPEKVRRSIEEPDNPGKLRFMIWDEIDGEPVPVGSVNATPKEAGVYETGSWVGKRYGGHNYAARGREILMAHTFDTLGATKLVSEVAEGNRASRKSVERSGYTLAGIEDGECHYEITAETYRRLHPVA